MSPTGKSFRFVSCVRARGGLCEVRFGEKEVSGTFPFPFWPREVFPFPSPFSSRCASTCAGFVLSKNIWAEHGRTPHPRETDLKRLKMKSDIFRKKLNLTGKTQSNRQILVKIK